MADDLTLTVTLRSAALDARRGIVRLHPEVMAALALRPGDPVRLTGARTTAGIVARAESTSSRALLYADDLILGNLGVRDGGQVTVTPVPVVAARRVTLTGPAEIVAVVSPEMLRLALLGKVVSAGDDVSLLPQDVLPGAGDRGLVEAARRSLANRVGYAWTSTLLTVTSLDGPDAALVTMDTVVAWQDGPVTAGPSVESVPVMTTEAPNLDDLPGLRPQAKELEELLDLGFNHGEVLARLGTKVTLGVLISGPSGSGKSALVQAVGAAVGASVRGVWAPELAALTNNAAAARLRELSQEVRGKTPAVLLISDVEALAPREEPGPISTVFRQVLAETVAAGAAVVCTTSKPESVDPVLRAPDLLAVQLTVPLPDAAMRREQLAALTRGMPLAEDVRLDDVAGRTPGFVAADLGALTREAGVRAALRHVGNGTGPDAPTVTMADFEAALDVVRPTSMAESTLEVAEVTLDDVGDMAEVKQTLTESVLWPLTYPDTFARLGVSPPRGVLLYGPPGCGKTYLVKAIAGTGKANVLSVKGAELLSKWVGDSERAVRELFRRAREAAPTLVFLDEVDALAPTRGQATDGGTADRVVAALLTELDGVEDLRNVVVIGATNRPDLIDPALLRPGRLERLVYVPPPDGEARAAILRASARAVPLDASVDLDELGAELEGFSAADCAALIRESALAAMRDSLEASTVTAANVATARKRVRASLDPNQVAWLAAYAETHQP
ncbi:putative microtubule-severing ATPase [Actinoplanes missouriensis 431]|uniref:Putative microtubule-severing ATPase n=1 Tax=Actinoplanes missouriensis (strain ATCC 14538 / DSM 43046 / CBS 188.64 / JCM 3121 / NBRC 102363 / NCIMB 12654 / NRRL B-3342 / UNCC 431) TaxID=512565 RepID=I0HIU6_ACTM4|nr:AAA family ATPase [Actinoplanes missouriensis]BAL92933.1 putative microtubule-severing ATPase [Actinoplanes missouriensis 431]